jgi:uncharacterized protein YyaL (SSP411 family)
VKPLAALRALWPALSLSLLTGLTGCMTTQVDAQSPAGKAPSGSAHGLVREGTPDEVNIARARAQGRARAFTWEAWGPAAFERARREHKFILLDGAAEWCHWCHVMDETTYLDPEIGRILNERFVTIRVDIDERPDIAERYGDWGWPATILFSEDAEEVGKYRGYLPPDEMKVILEEVQAAAKAAAADKSRAAVDLPAPVAALGWIGGLATVQLDGYYDEKQGSWGMRQKSPLGANVSFELARAAHGDKAAQARALFTLGKQRALLDPVWGGVYQYSAATDWNSPHYEKLMPYQAANLEAYAKGYALAKDPALLADAQKIASYMSSFLSNADGAFLVSQDADVGAHDHGARFVDGDVYYRLPDDRRRALGIPRIDEHVYAHENGLAIAAFASLYEAARDPSIAARARKAADHILRTLVGPYGAVKRGSASARYLADAASFGRGVARLAEATGEAVYRDAAVRIATAMERDLADPATGALFAHTADPAAAGVFARRDRPFIHTVTAARFLGVVARLTGDASYRERGRRVLAAIATPSAVAGRGRMLGELLLAVDEVGSYPWDGAAPAAPSAKERN